MWASFRVTLAKVPVPVKPEPLPRGDEIIQHTRPHFSELRTYDRAISGSINNENCRSSVYIDLDQDQSEGATIFKGNFSSLRGLRKAGDLGGCSTSQLTH